MTAENPIHLKPSISRPGLNPGFHAYLLDAVKVGDDGDVLLGDDLGGLRHDGGAHEGGGHAGHFERKR